MSAPTTTRRTRKTRPQTSRHPRAWRLPHLGWGWLLTALILLGVAKTWPLYTALAVGLIATAAVLAVVRPRRLTPLINRATAITDAINARRSPLPAPGRRTIAAFQRMRPDQFETAIAALCHEHPTVHTATRVGAANDRGADVIAHLYDGRRILIQCKRYRDGNNVGSETVQTINGVYRDIHHCHQAVIVTTAGFTRSAYDTNARLPHGIRLIDGHALEQWANGGHAPW